MVNRVPTAVCKPDSLAISDIVDALDQLGCGVAKVKHAGDGTFLAVIEYQTDYHVYDICIADDNFAAFLRSGEAAWDCTKGDVSTKGMYLLLCDIYGFVLYRRHEDSDLLPRIRTMAGNSLKRFNPPVVADQMVHVFGDNYQNAIQSLKRDYPFDKVPFRPYAHQN